MTTTPTARARLVEFWVLLCGLPGLALASESIETGERLSDWLLRQPNEGYTSGLQWRVPQERVSQRALRQRLLAQLREPSRPGHLAVDPLVRARFARIIEQAPVTGRVAVVLPDARWMQSFASRDPVLQADQSVVLPTTRPSTVTVLSAQGQPCQVRHVPGADARSYLEACLGPQADAVDWAWVAQPDGRNARYGVAAWNEQPQDEVAPGGWIWAPSRDSGFTEDFSRDFIRLLASLGPAADGSALEPLDSVRASALATPAERRLDGDYSANDWGTLGLMQTPSARMAAAGTLRINLSAASPYTRLNFMLQPLDWLEFGFRYTDIANQAYDASGTISSQSYKDKSLDLKLRLNQESAYLPQFALGMVDVGGTGLFSSEYLVASKRYGNTDWNLGLAWGYLGGRRNVNNPLGWINPNLQQRPEVAVGQGGTVSTNTMFTGPASSFGGVQWRVPTVPLQLKLEYDGNNYRREPFAAQFQPKSPFNMGLVYRYSSSVDWTLGYERGDQWMFGLTLHENLAATNTPKLLDPPAPAFSAQPAAAEPAWQSTAQDIERLTLWPVLALEARSDVLWVHVSSDGAAYVQDRLQRLVQVLHRDAPARVQRFVVIFEERGLAVHAELFDRAAWVRTQTQAQAHSQSTAAQRAFAPRASMVTKPSTGTVVMRPNAYTFGVEPLFDQIFGGPDAFVLYELGMQAKGEYRFAPSTWIGGAAFGRVLDNYSAFRYDAPSNLPRVRTYAREYATTSALNLLHLQLTHVNQVADNQYLSLYGGLLEGMFAGVGAEWLYRPWRSPVAWGLDVNRVQQRGFAQDFSLRDYSVNTGHATVYWDTGVENILAKVSVGQYLAGDQGATLDVSRRFSNGVVIGVYATRTNVSAEQFGEGSFDKGLYLSIPLDAMLARSSNASVNFRWRPLLRDGGAQLNRAYPMYDLTNLRDPMAQRMGPATPQQPKTGDRWFD